MQVYTSLQADNHASTPITQFFLQAGTLPAAQPAASKHWRQKLGLSKVNRHFNLIGPISEYDQLPSLGREPV